MLARRPRALFATLAACSVLAACGGGSGGATGGGGTSGAGSSGGSSGSAASAGTNASDAAEDSGSAAAGSAPDPCTLVTAAELSTAYGVTFGDGKADDTDVASSRGFRACKWEDAGGTKSFLLQTVGSGGALGESAGDLFDQSKALYPGAADGGAGDKSILLADNGGFLAVRGDVFVQGNPIIFGASTPAGASASVLQTVVGKLG